MAPEITQVQPILVTTTDLFIIASLIGTLVAIGLVLFVFPFVFSAHKKKLEEEAVMKRKSYLERMACVETKLVKEINATEMEKLSESMTGIAQTFTGVFLELHQQRLKTAELIDVAKTAEMFMISPEGKATIHETIPKTSTLVNMGSVYNKGDKIFYNGKLSLVMHNDGTVSLYGSDGTNVGILQDPKGLFITWIKQGENVSSWEKS